MPETARDSGTGMTSSTLTVDLDGITPVPHGHCATIKTYLAQDVSAPAPVDLAPARLERLTGRDEARYRRIFTTLGTRWLWWSRLLLTSAERIAILDDPAVEAYAVVFGGGDAGLLELDFRQPVADLAFLGLLDTALGKGLGTKLVRHALHASARHGARRISVNTCTFDHPAALALYRRCGFEALYQAIEIVPDPRISGILPLKAAPHVPMLTP